jgi:hypothetical protein
MNEKVVARFAGFESYFYAIAILVILIYLDTSVYIEASNHPPGTTAIGYALSYLRMRAITGVGLLLSPFMVLAELAFLWQLTFKKRAAVWIADGQLVLFNYVSGIPMTGTLFTRVALESIDHLSFIPAKPLSCSTVVLHLKNGARRYIPALLLTENAAALMSRLSAACWRLPVPHLWLIEAHERQGHLLHAKLNDACETN